jgi:hypothetical protein
MGKTPEVRDINGDRIEIGVRVKYLNTGTLGRAADIMEDEEGVWVLFDTTSLWYKPETLILTDEEAAAETEKKATAGEARDYLRRMEEEAKERDLSAVNQVTGGG